MISKKPSSFRSGTPLNSWQNLIYSAVPIKLETIADHHSQRDIENPTDCFISSVVDVKRRLHAMFWDVAENFVPQIKHIREKKLLHHQALELVKRLCTEVVKSNILRAPQIFMIPLHQAISFGIREIVEEILKSDPNAINLRTIEDQTIFQYAIMCRSESVFNLIYQLEDYSHALLSSQDMSSNNALHLAGFLGPMQQLKVSAAGPALQVQRELQWFKMKAKSGASGGWQLQFRRNLLAWEEEELQRLLGMLVSSPCLRDGLEDYCTWLAESSGRFTVASVWRWWVANRGSGLVVPSGVWVSLAPPKMQFTCWLAWRGRLKTASFLQSIGAIAESANTLCIFCQAEVETVDHVFLLCPMVWKFWSQLVDWWELVWAIPGSVAGLLHWWAAGKFRFKSWVLKIWQIIPSFVFWSVWKLRNECLFKGTLPDFQVLCEKVKLQIALWTKWHLKVDYSVHDIVSNLHQIRWSAGS